MFACYAFSEQSQGRLRILVFEKRQEELTIFRLCKAVVKRSLTSQISRVHHRLDWGDQQKSPRNLVRPFTSTAAVSVCSVYSEAALSLSGTFTPVENAGATLDS